MSEERVIVNLDLPTRQDQDESVRSSGKWADNIERAALAAERLRANVREYAMSSGRSNELIQAAIRSDSDLSNRSVIKSVVGEEAARSLIAENKQYWAEQDRKKKESDRILDRAIRAAEKEKEEKESSYDYFRRVDKEQMEHHYGPGGADQDIYDQYSGEGGGVGGRKAKKRSLFGGRQGLYYGGLGTFGPVGYAAYMGIRAGESALQSYFQEGPALAQGYGQGTLGAAVGTSAQIREMRAMRMTNAVGGVAEGAGTGLSGLGGYNLAGNIAATAAGTSWSGPGVAVSTGMILGGIAIREIASVFRMWRESTEREITAKQSTALQMFEQAMGARMQMAGTTLSLRALGRRGLTEGYGARDEARTYGEYADNLGYSAAEIGQQRLSFAASGGTGLSQYEVSMYQRAYGLGGDATGRFARGFNPGMGIRGGTWGGVPWNDPRNVSRGLERTLTGARSAGIPRALWGEYAGRIGSFSQARGEVGGDTDLDLSEGRRQGLIDSGLRGYQAQHVIEASQQGMGGLADELGNALLPQGALRAVSMARLLQQHGGNIGSALHWANEAKNTQEGVDFNVGTARMFGGGLMSEVAMDSLSGMEMGSRAGRKLLRNYAGGKSKAGVDAEGDAFDVMFGPEGDVTSAQATRENMKIMSQGFSDIVKVLPLLVDVLKYALDNMKENTTPGFSQARSDLAALTAGTPLYAARELSPGGELQRSGIGF